MKTKRLATDAVLAAMFTVLALLAVNVGDNMKFTFESVPVIMAGLLFGPGSGFAVGTAGSLVYQLLTHGITATTILWMLPYMLCGLISGLFSKGAGLRQERGRTVLMICLCELAVFAVNTLALYVDGNMYGWYNKAVFLSMLPFRALVCIIKSAVFSFLLPSLAASLRKELRL